MLWFLCVNENLISSLFKILLMLKYILLAFAALLVTEEYKINTVAEIIVSHTVHSKLRVIFLARG